MRKEGGRYRVEGRARKPKKVRKGRGVENTRERGKCKIKRNVEGRRETASGK